MKEAVAIIGGTLVGIGLIAGFLESAGPPELEPNPLAMHIHGVDADDLRELALQGLEVPHLDDALAFRIHGIDDAFIDSLRDQGFDDLGPDELIEMKIWGPGRVLAKRERR